MKLSGMVAHFAEALVLDQGEVAGMARQLREAGMIRSGGRGPGAAEMTSDDFINLFLGVCACRFAKNTPAVVPVPRNVPRVSERQPGTALPELLAREGDTVAQFLRDLFTAAVSAEGLQTLYGSRGHLALSFTLGLSSLEVDAAVRTPGVDRTTTIYFAPRSWDAVPEHPERKKGFGGLVEQRRLRGGVVERDMDTLARLAERFPQ